MSMVLVGLAFAAGCEQAPKPPQSPEQLNGRLEAAGKIANSADKSDALKVVAVDAADSGVVEVVIKAIDGIPNISTKDDTAETCALKLMKRGDTKAATTVAEKITNQATKNAVLGKIAKDRR